MKKQVSKFTCKLYDRGWLEAKCKKRVKVCNTSRAISSKVVTKIMIKLVNVIFRDENTCRCIYVRCNMICTRHIHIYISLHALLPVSALQVKELFEYSAVGCTYKWNTQNIGLVAKEVCTCFLSAETATTSQSEIYIATSSFIYRIMDLVNLLPSSNTNHLTFNPYFSLYILLFNLCPANFVSVLWGNGVETIANSFTLFS